MMSAAPSAPVEPLKKLPALKSERWRSASTLHRRAAKPAVCSSVCRLSHAADVLR
jgi:hypothetical protein